MASTGKLILKSIPEGEAREKLFGYLAKLFNNPPRSKLEELAARTSKNPVVLRKDIPQIKAEKIVSNLNKLGAVAVFLPHEPASKQELQQPIQPKVEIKKKPELQSQKNKINGISSPSKASQPRSINPKKSSKNQTEQKRSYRSFVLILIMLSLAGGLFYSSPNILQFDYIKKYLNQKTGKTLPSEGGNDSVGGSSGLSVPYYLMANTNPVEQFDIIHSAYYDQRVVEGMSEAIHSYVKLFSKEPNLKVKVTSGARQTDMTHFLVTYNVSINKVKKTYRASISTDTKDVLENLAILQGLLGKFSIDFAEFVAPKSSVILSKSNSGSEILQLLSSFDYHDMFEVLRKVEKEVSTKKCDPELLLYANEVFSWLAIFKNAYDNPDLANILSRHAVGTYLLASLFQDKEESALSFNQSLLLLGLNYPAEAVNKLNSNMGKRGQVKALLTAYIKNDTEKLQSISKEQFINKKLAGYLLSRAYNNSGQNSQALKQYNNLLSNYPDFLPAKEYAIRNGNVALSKAFMWQYIGDIFEKHLYLTREFLNIKWINDDATLQSEIAKAVNQEDYLEKWFNLHKKILNKTTMTNGNGKLLTPNFIKSFLKEEVLNAIHILYNLEANMLARLPNADKVVDLLQRVYPDSDLTHSLKLKLLASYQKSLPLFEYVKKININEAGPYLLADLLNLYVSLGVDGINTEKTKAVDLLANFRRKTSPNAAGSLYLYAYYKYYNYEPVAQYYLKRIESINPYNYATYSLISQSDDEGRFIERSDKYLKNSYGVAMFKGNWYSNHKQPDKAIEYYAQAIKLSPDQYAAYSMLGEAYEKQKKFDTAIKTWKKYLKYDDSSLNAVAINNKISQVYMDRGQNKKAYDILLKTKDSYQHKALINFALASEKNGNTLQAEEYLKKASERYPSSSAPIELSIFYLRQNNEATSIDVLKEYERYNHYSYYFSKFIEYYIEADEPMEAIRIVKKVKGRDYDVWVTWNLASIYAEKKRFDIAAKLIKPLIGQQEQPYYFAVNYLDHFIKGNLGNQKDAVDELITRLSDHPGKIQFFGIGLISEGYYDAAYKVFEKLDSMTGRQSNTSLLFMALSWRAGSKDPMQKEKIVEKLNVYPIQGMHKTLVKYLIDDANEIAVLKEIDNPNKACEAHYFLGLVKSQEKKMDEAMKHLLISFETKAAKNIEYKYANDLLKKLNK